MSSTDAVRSYLEHDIAIDLGQAVRRSAHRQERNCAHGQHEQVAMSAARHATGYTLFRFFFGAKWRAGASTREWWRAGFE